LVSRKGPTLLTQSSKDLDAIDAEHVRKSFRDVIALEGLTIRVHRGEVLGLLGPNGAGKTTFIRLLLGLTKPDSGRIKVFGFDPTTSPLEVRSRLGFVLQERSVDYYLTGRENLKLQAGLYSLPPEQTTKRIDDLLGWAGLSAAADRVVLNYSGGMRRRLEFAMSMVTKRLLLILDEPTLGLDVSSRREIWRMIHTIRDEGITILLATHYLDEANVLCDRVVIIDRGKVVVEGEPEDLKKRTVAELHRLVVRFTSVPSKDELDSFAKLSFEIRGDDVVFKGPPNELWRLVADLQSRYADSVLEISYRQPTLEDVFMKYTSSHY
jgi:ABC-2 type transport system ATP-binding protein